MYKLKNLIKSLLFIFAVTSIAFSASIGMIDGYRVTGTGQREHAALCNAVIAVRMLKRQRACNYLTEKEYCIRVKSIIRSLELKGLKVN